MTDRFDPAAYKRSADGEAEVQLKHHFDAAHRLPHLTGGNSKCASLHGHTWGDHPIHPDCRPGFLTAAGAAAGCGS